jgi:hypothetical protein
VGIIGNRYFITGVQIGMLIAMKDENDRTRILNKIIETQCIGKSKDLDRLLGMIDNEN